MWAGVWAAMADRAPVLSQRWLIAHLLDLWQARTTEHRAGRVSLQVSLQAGHPDNKRLQLHPNLMPIGAGQDRLREECGRQAGPS